MAHDTAQAAARAITVAAIILPSPPSSARATTFSASARAVARAVARVAVARDSGSEGERDLESSVASAVRCRVCR